MPVLFVVQYYNKRMYPERRVFMKRLIAALLCILTVILCFSSCVKSEAARACEEKIAAIGEVTLEKELLIVEAGQAYNGLSDKDKALVSSAALTSAEEKLGLLKAFSADAQAVLALYEKALTEYGVKKEEIADAYKALSAKLNDCRADIKPEFEKIFEAVRLKNEEYEKIAADAVASAKAYINYFRGMNTDKDITVTDIGCIAQTEDGNVYYLFAFSCLCDGKEETYYSGVRFAGTPGKETFSSFYDSFYASAPSSEKTDALISGNIEISATAVN